MTYDKWLNDLNEYTTELPRTYKDFHKNFGELVWSSATIAERERCARIAEDGKREASKEWQSLSDEEIGRLAVFDGLHHVEIPLLAKFIIAIEKALRDKNG